MAFFRIVTAICLLTLACSTASAQPVAGYFDGGFGVGMSQRPAWTLRPLASLGLYMAGGLEINQRVGIEVNGDIMAGADVAADDDIVLKLLLIGLRGACRYWFDSGDSPFVLGGAGLTILPGGEPGPGLQAAVGYGGGRSPDDMRYGVLLSYQPTIIPNDEREFAHSLIVNLLLGEQF